MTASEAIIVLKTLITDLRTCRTEREALEVAIEILEKESDGE